MPSLSSSFRSRHIQPPASRRASAIEPLESRMLLHGTGFEAGINFQKSTPAAPSGYFIDSGQVFGDRGNGLAYGWDADNTASARDRNNSLFPDQRYDTLTHMQLYG